MKRFYTLLTFALIVSISKAQMFGQTAYLVGDYIEVGLDGDRGVEGGDTTLGYVPGLHVRNSGFSPYHGFVADPSMTGWTSFDGDFFIPGSPENGWGLEVGGSSGIDFANNRSGDNDIPGAFVGYTSSSGCQAVDWRGQAVAMGSGPDIDFTVDMRYTLSQSDLYYTTEVIITNNSMFAQDSIFFYRTVDPDNNVVLSADYATQNTINNQPTPGCEKALVTARHTLPWNSYVGFGAVGLNFRVAYGGFTNRDGSDIWYGVNGMEGTLGMSATADQAMALAYVIEHLDPGESARFKFVVILSASQVDQALGQLFELQLNDATQSSLAPACAGGVDTLVVCGSNPVDLELSSNGINDFTWTWSPGTYLSSTTGTMTTYTPGTDQAYTVTGTPVSPCYTASVVKDFYIKLSPGPDVQVTTPVSACGSYNLDSLSVTDLNSIPSTVITYHSLPPDSANDMSNQLPTNVIYPGDSAYVMISTPTGGGCYDFELVNFVWDSLTWVINSVDHIPCGGSGSDGSFDVSVVTGGVSPYTYDIGGGPQPTGLFTGLFAGAYTVTIIDANGCSADTVITINSTPAVTVTASVTPEVSGFDGAIDITPMGGTPPYTYDWDMDGTGDYDDPQDVAGLTSGFYTVVVMDDAGCTDTISVFVATGTGIFSNTDDIQITVGPNPTEGWVNIIIRSEKYNRAELEIIDALGRIVSVTSLVANEANSIDLTNHERGTYLLRIVIENSQTVIRVIRE